MPSAGDVMTEHEYNQLSPAERAGWMYKEDVVPDVPGDKKGDQYPQTGGYAGYYTYVPVPTDPGYSYVWDPYQGSADPQGYWTTGRGSWRRDKIGDLPDQPDHSLKPPSDPSLIGEWLRYLGYNWLGPGTDIVKNLEQGKEPIDELDRVAMLHDFAYLSALQDFESGKISYQVAVRRIGAADDAFVRNLSGFQDPMSRLAGTAMTMKQLYDWYTGYPNYSGLYKDSYLDRRLASKYAEPDWVPYEGEVKLQYLEHINPYKYFGSPRQGYEWVFTDMGWKQHKADTDVMKPDKPVKPFVAPEVPISAFSDRNRNGIPDVLEKKSRKRSRHNKFTRWN